MRLALLALMLLFLSVAPLAQAQESLRAQAKPRLSRERSLESLSTHQHAADPTGVRRRLTREHRSAPHKRGSALDTLEKALQDVPRSRGHHGR